MRARRYAGFTLLELLIVIAIIVILATLILSGLAAARRRTFVAVAKNNINAIKAALQAYETDTGRYPARPNHSTMVGANLFQNDIAYAYAALRNRKTAAHGGGPNSPYLDWKDDQVGLAPNTVESGNTFGATNPLPEIPAPPGIQEKADPNQINQPAYQLARLPNSGQALVFLDPWGNPYVYREWASVPVNVKDTLTFNGTSVLKTGGGTSGSSGEPHVDRVHDPSKFDIYSFGPNGVNEYGEGDDVVSWGDTK